MHGILPFLWGAIAGTTSCILFFFIVFKRINDAMLHTVQKKALKHAEYGAVAKEAAAIAPAKVEAICKLARFNNGIVGEAVQCRMVFYSGTIDVYEVLELRTLRDRRQEVVAEKMLGRINSACVVATAQRISKYHRHVNVASRYATVKGKCTILTHKEGLPLFLEDPMQQLGERLQKQRKEQEEMAQVERLRRHLQRTSTTLTDEEILAQVRATAAVAVAKQTVDFSSFLPRHMSENGSEKTSHTSKQSHRAKHSRLKGKKGASIEEEPFPQCSCIAIKFPTRREQERWLNLLQSTPQSAQWRDFIMHLPQFDVFNLLVARLFFENSRSNGLHDLIKSKLQKKLATVSKNLPQRLRGDIYLDGLEIGGEIPLISNVSNTTLSAGGETEFDFDLLYRGGLALCIRFAVFYRDIRVPDIVFNIKVLELAGRMRFNVGPPPTKKFWLGGPRPPQLRLESTQEVASHDGILNAVLNLLPDMSQVMSNIVRYMLFEDMVLPNLDDFPWPAFDEDEDLKLAKHAALTPDATGTAAQLKKVRLNTNAMTFGATGNINSGKHDGGDEENESGGGDSSSIEVAASLHSMSSSEDDGVSIAASSSHRLLVFSTNHVASAADVGEAMARGTPKSRHTPPPSSSSLTSALAPPLSSSATTSNGQHRSGAPVPHSAAALDGIGGSPLPRPPPTATSSTGRLPTSELERRLPPRPPSLTRRRGSSATDLSEASATSAPSLAAASLAAMPLTVEALRYCGRPRVPSSRGPPRHRPDSQVNGELSPSTAASTVRRG